MNMLVGLLFVAIRFGNLAGAVTGERRGASRGTKAIRIGGVLVLAAAFGAFGLAKGLLAQTG